MQRPLSDDPHCIAVCLLCVNGDTDGADGSIDAPSEAIVRGSELVVSNFDRVFPGAVNTQSSTPYILSVFPLEAANR